MKNPQTVTLALTGASGMPYGIRLLEMLLAEGKQVYLLYSQVAQIVAQQEMNLALPSLALRKPKHSLITCMACLKGNYVYLDGKNGLRPLLPVQIRPIRWWFALVPWEPQAIAAGMNQKLIERAAMSC